MQTKSTDPRRFRIRSGSANRPWSTTWVKIGQLLCLLRVQESQPPKAVKSRTSAGCFRRNSETCQNHRSWLQIVVNCCVQILRLLRVCIQLKRDTNITTIDFYHKTDLRRKQILIQWSYSGSISSSGDARRHLDGYGCLIFWTDPLFYWQPRIIYLYYEIFHWRSIQKFSDSFTQNTCNISLIPIPTDFFTSMDWPGLFMKIW